MVDLVTHALAHGRQCRVDFVRGSGGEIGDRNFEPWDLGEDALMVVIDNYDTKNLMSCNELVQNDLDALGIELRPVELQVHIAADPAEGERGIAPEYVRTLQVTEGERLMPPGRVGNDR